MAELTCLVWTVKQLRGYVREMDIYYIRTNRMLIVQLYSFILCAYFFQPCLFLSRSEPHLLLSR